MTTTEIVILVVYAIGVIANVTVFLIQKAEITKLKNITDHVERYFKIFDIDTFEKYIKLKEKGFEQEKDILLKDLANKMTNEYLEKIGKPALDNGIKEFRDEIGKQYNELGLFIIDFLSSLTEREREKLIKNHFPLTGKLLLDQLDEIDKEKERFNSQL